MIRLIIFYVLLLCASLSPVKAIVSTTTDFPPTTYNWSLDSGISVNQIVNQKGAVVIKGTFVKPVTADIVKVSISYKNASGIWVEVWCRTFPAQDDFNGILSAAFELPASSSSSIPLKAEIGSNTSLTNWQSVTWRKEVSHYKQGDYTVNACATELDENKYTILLTPKRTETLVYGTTSNLTGIKDRVNSTHIFNKQDNVIFSLYKTPTLLTDANGAKSVKIVNTGALTDVIAGTPEINYNVTPTRPIPYLYSYNDPVYLIAGKFSANGVMLKFSQWPGDTNGPGYHDFRNPNALISRYFNYYNYLTQKISDLFTDQEPIVLVSSKRTGLRVYKQNGTFIQVTGTSNYTGTYFGYPPDQGGGMRGPGSEDFIISNTSSATIYGMGAIRNDQFGDNALPIGDINTEIAKFINYVGIFGNTIVSSGSDCSTNCLTINTGALPDYVPVDWTKAPNSYIFDPTNTTNGDGLKIPVQKAYTMWQKDNLIGGMPIPAGTATAEVLWEDNHGLIKSGNGYSLMIEGSGESAKIKVPINKSKEGNAVIAYKVNGTIYWSWHVWVTDDPTNGSTYKSFTGVKREKPDGTTELIPDSEWGWMDRNLGAVASTLTESQMIKSGGLLYQFGRKDPIPPLAYKGSDFYEVSGSIGRVRHRQARNFAGAVNIDSFTKYVPLGTATVTNNLRLAVNNPLSLIYVNKNDNSGPAYYLNGNGTDNLALMVNWFGTSPTLAANNLSELNLWSDNSKGKIQYGYNDDVNAAPYRPKSQYDPCPNGWRIPSALAANLASNTYIDDIRVDYSPFGVRTNIGNNVFINNKYYIVKPSNANMPSFMQGIKVFPNSGMDFSNVGGYNMGIFPGTGQIYRLGQNGQYSDQHETGLWTATMAKHFDTTPNVVARSLHLIPDIGQPDIPDSSLPNITGRYWYMPYSGNSTNDAQGCRCIKDPLYIVDKYNFPTEYFVDNSNYVEGLSQPNSYQRVKNTTAFTIEIPVSKAFSAQNQLLNNPSILNPANFNALMANVLWASNTNLINKVTILNPSPSSVSALSSTKILVEIKPNQSGNAVVTLHNGSITNPVYWSWHIWITDTAVGSNTYTTILPDQTATNYLNYSKNAIVLKTEIMDRDLGASDVLSEANKTTVTAGLHYQWGRKDPMPIFNNANRYAIPIYLGTVQSTGAVTYTTLASATYYSNAYLALYNNYAGAAGVVSTDKPAEKMAKVLGYSVKNPLIFMAPSTLTSKNANTNLTNASDWLADEPNLAPDRWGRGLGKSPFDPCPDGWRIPDVVGVENSSAGSSPFYKPNVTGISITTNYGGARVNRNPYSSVAIAHIFASPSYNIGSFVSSQVRGARSTIDGAAADYNALELVYGGFWLGALSNNYTGRALRTEIQYAGSYITPFSSNSDPYFGQSCRCVKVRYDAKGRELFTAPEVQVTSISAGRPTGVLSKADLENIPDAKLVVFPNPVENDLNINGRYDIEYFYQLYNISGQMVKEGKFQENKMDLSGLPSGVYLLRINNAEQIFKIIKK